MKFKKIFVNKYKHVSRKGTYIISQVQLLFDVEEAEQNKLIQAELGNPPPKVITCDNFDQETDDYHISIREIERIEKMIKNLPEFCKKVGL